jgi:hypothetical protein
VDTVAWAIGVDHGHLSLKLRKAYAKVLIEVAAKHSFDSFTGIALIWHESGWKPSAIGDGGEAIGLGQIHYRNLCATQPEQCEAKRVQLLNPAYNIRAMGHIIAYKRRWCRQQTGRAALFARWLHAYGYKQRKNLKCNMRRTKTGWRDKKVPTEVRRIIQYRRKLIRKLESKRRRRRRSRRR